MQTCAPLNRLAKLVFITKVSFLMNPFSSRRPVCVLSLGLVTFAAMAAQPGGQVTFAIDTNAQVQVRAKFVEITSADDRFDYLPVLKMASNAPAIQAVGFLLNGGVTNRIESQTAHILTQP